MNDISCEVNNRVSEPESDQIKDQPDFVRRGDTGVGHTPATITRLC